MVKRAIARGFDAVACKERWHRSSRLQLHGMHAHHVLSSASDGHRIHAIWRCLAAGGREPVLIRNSFHRIRIRIRIRIVM
ncbi:hypothetical protein [Xanthomonas fragariae]|uniref:hypothetical protein n=2 Tax=Xanthomonas fragariae TaxID=48664 RepID=UPI001F4092A0|nr:hypothetical protein [Xanthomonas fragariae]